VTDEGVLRSYDGQAEQNQVVLRISSDSALMLLGAVYEEIGVDITTRDPQTHTIGNRNFSKYYRLGDSPLSTYVGCGDTEYGPAANKRRVTMSLVSTVTPESGGSVVRTHLEARAEQPEHGNWSACLTTGALERRINKGVELRTIH
jgi:hypothetical protein